MSKSTIIVIAVVAVVLIGGGVWYWSAGQSAPATPYQPPVTQQPSSSPTTPTLPSPGNPPAQPTEPKIESYTVTGNDSTGSPTSITAHKGDTVQVTFSVDAANTYHGGLDFRSSVVNTGPIAPGSSKTISFTAGDSFVFTPYWPSTNIKKPYVVSVLVQ